VKCFIQSLWLHFSIILSHKFEKLLLFSPLYSKWMIEMMTMMINSIHSNSWWWPTKLINFRMFMMKSSWVTTTKESFSKWLRLTGPSQIEWMILNYFAVFPLLILSSKIPLLVNGVGLEYTIYVHSTYFSQLLCGFLNSLEYNFVRELKNIPLFVKLVTLFQKLRRQPNTRISLTRSFIFPKTLVSVRLTHGIIWDQISFRCSNNSLSIMFF
jgi:hypothetical protein